MAFNPGANTYLPISPVLPNMLLISNITRSYPMVITVEESNTYIVGQMVKLTIPSDYGMFQADQRTGVIVAINGLNFSVNIDSTQFDTFTIPPSGIYRERPASLSPAGSRNIYNTLAVPFRSEGNFGN
jgi:hypothetical protein